MIDPTQMHVEGGVPLEEVDPLTEAVGDFKSDFPCLAPDRLLEFTLVKITQKDGQPKDDKPGSKMLNLKVRLEEDTTFTDNKPARKGFSFVQNILISPSGEYKIESIKRILSLWNKAVLGTEAGKAQPFAAMRDNPNLFEGKLFQGRTSIKKGSGGYPDQTQITPVIPDNTK